ncbi:hypothetical protein RJ641_014541 [Dillenia turbinata]|uniref:GST N-terminal domain-containing protein n=1 Tax=Dillenia turbinata TaxID=194707 RepID=A0AAN8V3Q8_9MAGN
MEDEKKVKLYGAWFSPFERRVELALKAKAYHMNGWRKTYTTRVSYFSPTILSTRKSQCSFMMAKQNPSHFLPDDPYKRAKVRYWASFFDQQVLIMSTPQIL